MTQYAGYAVIATLAVFAKSGTVNAAEYQFGTHAEATYNAEAIKQQFQRSVRTPPGASTGAVPRYLYASGQDDPTQTSVQFNQPVTPATAGLALIHWGEGQDYVDSAGYYARPFSQPTLSSGYLGDVVITLPQIEDRPTQQVWKSVVAGNTPRVPGYWVASQADPSQIGAWYARPPNAATLTSGYLGAFQSTAEQFQDRPTIQLWPAAIAGRTPGIGAYTIALESQTDLTRQATLTPPSIGRPSQMAYQQAAPQLLDLTQQPQWQESLQAAPVVLGPTVLPYAVLPQPDINVNYSVFWTPSTFSPSAPTPPDTSLPGGPWGNPAAGRGTMSESIGFREAQKPHRERKHKPEPALTPIEKEIQQLLNKLPEATAVTIADALPKAQLEKLTTMEGELREIEKQMAAARTDEEAIAILLMMLA